MIVVITGVAGFIGSHLAKKYLDDGHSILGIDDFSSSFQRSKHFLELRKHSNFSFRKISIEDPKLVTLCTSDIARINQSEPVLILNFACPASPPIYQSIPLKTLNTCFNGTKNVLDLARKLNARVIHASTSEIYGDPLKSPQIESDWGNVNSFGPRSCYDEGKRAAETLCWIYLNDLEDPVDIRIIRIFNTAGPNMDPSDGRVISNFLCQALQNEKLTIYGTGLQSRSFCYIDDLVKGIISLGELSENPKTPINLGNPHEFSMNELAQHVLHVTKISQQPQDIDLANHVVYTALPTDDPQQRRPDIQRANDLLGWEPKIELSQALQSMLPYFQQVAKRFSVQNKKYFIYCHTNRTTGKKYIGYTGTSLLMRWKTHIKNSKRSNLKFHCAIRKYGLNDWDHEILKEVENLEEAKMSERRFIALYNSYEDGYNMTYGGDGIPGVCQKGRKFTAKHREKLRNAKLGKKTGRKIPPQMAIAKRALKGTPLQSKASKLGWRRRKEKLKSK